MLIKFFKSKHTLALVVMLLLFILECIFLYFSPLTPGGQAQRWAVLDFSWLVEKPPFFLAFQCLFVALLSVVVLRISYHQVVSDQGNYLPLFFALTLLPASLKGEIMGLVVPGLFLVSLAFRKLFYLYQAEKKYTLVFDVALLISLASLIYMPLLYFILLIPCALWIYKLSFPRHLVLALMGGVTPYLFYSVWLFWFNQFSWFWECKWPQLHLLQFPTFELLSLRSATFYLGLLAFAMVAGFQVLRSIADRGIKQRKAYGLVFGYVLIATFSLFVGVRSLEQHLIIFTVPVVFLLSDFFIQNRKKWVNDLLLLLYLVLLLINLLE